MRVGGAEGGRAAMSPPETSYASAQAASLAELTSVAQSRSSTVISEPADSPSRGAEMSPAAPMSRSASAATVTLSVRLA